MPQLRSFSAPAVAVVFSASASASAGHPSSFAASAFGPLTRP